MAECLETLSLSSAWDENQKKIAGDILYLHFNVPPAPENEQRRLKRTDKISDDIGSWVKSAAVTTTTTVSKLQAEPAASTASQKNMMKTKVGDKSSVTTYDQYCNVTSVQTVTQIPMPPVKSIPKSTYWTPMLHNIITDDAKELTHLPYLSDDVISTRKFVMFESELTEAYGGNYHGDGPQKLLTDKDFIAAVDELVKCHQLTVKDSKLWKLFAEKHGGQKSRDELQNRYEEIKKQENAAKKLPINLDDSGVTEAAVQPPEVTMHSFNALFCRRCFVYDCQRHDLFHEAKDYTKRTKIKKDDAVVMDCEYGNRCYKFQSVPSARSKDQIRGEWDGKEISMFRPLWNSFENQYCFIASLLLVKTCSQVYELSKLLKSEEDEGFGSPGTAGGHLDLGAMANKQDNVEKDPVCFSPPAELSQPIRAISCKHTNGLPCGSINPSCYCGQKGLVCEKFCLCDDSCHNRFRGCKCKSNCDLNKDCPCSRANRECDPDLCLSCKSDEHQPNTKGCGNVSMQRQYEPYDLTVQESNVHKGGWGLFTNTDIDRGQFIMEYRGEKISHDEAERRGLVYDIREHTFLFNLNDHFVLDSTRLGNSARFINSSKKPNAFAKTMLVNGDHRIGIYAKRDIEAGDELLMDYHNALKTKASFKIKASVCSKTSSSSK